MRVVTIKNNYYSHQLYEKWQIGLETRYGPSVSHLKEAFKYDMFKRMNTALHTLEKRYLYSIVVKEIPK